MTRLEIRIKAIELAIEYCKALTISATQLIDVANIFEDYLKNV